MPIYVGVASDQSSIDPEFGSPTPIVGNMTLDVGSLPPNVATVTFNLKRLDLVSGTTQIQLDPAIQNAGLGVLNAGNSFLIPSLHLSVIIGGGLPQSITLADVTGTFGPDGCESSVCLDTSFVIAAGASQGGDLTVTLHGLPEPSSIVLVASGIGLAGAAGRRRRHTHFPDLDAPEANAAANGGRIR